MSLRFTAIAKPEADPQIILRILGLFAQRYVMPHKVQADHQGEDMNIIVDVAGVNGDMAQILCHKMEQMVAVVQVEWKKAA